MSVRKKQPNAQKRRETADESRICGKHNGAVPLSANSGKQARAPEIPAAPPAPPKTPAFPQIPRSLPHAGRVRRNLRLNAYRLLPELVAAYAPLVRSVAQKYEGRGAEFDDLVQEGNLALLLLIPQCPDMDWLALYLRNNLPWQVSDAARRPRKRT